MTAPDFARTDLGRLTDPDLQFLVENFPVPGRSYEQMSRLILELPTTLESLLESQYVVDKILDRRAQLLRISPFLLFNVLLRQCIPGRRTPTDRKVISYLANLLAVFMRTERLYRVQPDDDHELETLVDLLAQTTQADKRRRFLLHAHIGNYALYLVGLFPGWLAYRHRYKRRPVSPSYYTDLGRVSFQQASTHPLAAEYGLADIFLRLALMFDQYKASLNRLSSQYIMS